MGMVSRLMAIFLAFFLCVAAPFSLAVLSDNITARYLVMEDCVNFIDDVSDTRILSKEKLSQFYLDTSSHGMMIDVEVSKYQRVVEPDINASGKLVDTYVYQACEPTSGISVNFETGDKIVVHVKPIGYTASQRIVMSTIGRILPDFDYTFPKRVR